MIHNAKSYCIISVLIVFILVKFNNAIILFKFLAVCHILKRSLAVITSRHNPQSNLFFINMLMLKKTPLYGININKREVILKLTCTPKLLTDLLYFISGKPMVYSYFTSIFLHLVWQDILLQKGSFNYLFTYFLLTSSYTSVKIKVNICLSEIQRKVPFVFINKYLAHTSTVYNHLKDIIIIAKIYISIR